MSGSCLESRLNTIGLSGDKLSVGSSSLILGMLRLSLAEPVVIEVKMAKRECGKEGLLFVPR